jgi:hypothetical protein
MGFVVTKDAIQHIFIAVLCKKITSEMAGPIALKAISVQNF